MQQHVNIKYVFAEKYTKIINKQLKINWYRNYACYAATKQLANLISA